MVQLKQEFEVAKASQMYETLAIVVSKALGGGKSETMPSSKPVESWEEAVAAFTAVGGKVVGG